MDFRSIKEFTEQVGRFVCNSLFGGATIELESPISFIPLRLSVQEVDDNGAKLLYRMVQLGGHQQSTAVMKRRGFAADGRVGHFTSIDHHHFQPQQRLYQLEARTARDRRWQPLRQLELGESEDWPGEIQLDQLEPNQRYQVGQAKKLSRSCIFASVPSTPGWRSYRIGFLVRMGANSPGSAQRASAQSALSNA